MLKTSVSSVKSKTLGCCIYLLLVNNPAFGSVPLYTKLSPKPYVINCSVGKPTSSLENNPKFAKLLSGFKFTPPKLTWGAVRLY